MFLHIASHGHRSDVENMALSLGGRIGLFDSISRRIGNKILKEDGKKIFVSGFKFQASPCMHATKYQLDCSLHYHWAGKHVIQC
jgi:hypothetical protein